MAQLHDAIANTADVLARHYAGVGTPGTNGFVVDPQGVAAQIIKTAEAAYQEFSDLFADWRDQKPGGSATAFVTAARHGYGSAAVFSQLLYGSYQCAHR